MAAPADDDSDAAVDSESEDSSPETASAEDCADSYAALPVIPTATGPQSLERWMMHVHSVQSTAS